MKQLSLLDGGPHPTDFFWRAQDQAGKDQMVLAIDSYIRGETRAGL